MMEYALEAELNYIFGKMAVFHRITVLLVVVKMPVFFIMLKITNRLKDGDLVPD